jgi:Zn finger protein HypA/HybF involved in hydrogenase expression
MKLVMRCQLCRKDYFQESVLSFMTCPECRSQRSLCLACKLPFYKSDLKSGACPKCNQLDNVVSMEEKSEASSDNADVS